MCQNPFLFWTLPFVSLNCECFTVKLLAIQGKMRIISFQFCPVKGILYRLSRHERIWSHRLRANNDAVQWAEITQAVHRPLGGDSPLSWDTGKFSKFVKFLPKRPTKDKTHENKRTFGDSPCWHDPNPKIKTSIWIQQISKPYQTHNLTLIKEKNEVFLFVAR